MVMDITTFLMVTLLSGFVVASKVDNSVTVETNVGTIIGYQRDVNIFGKPVKVSRFLGIPYAEPPIGELRFQRPVPKAQFTSPHEAKQHGNVCFQQLDVVPPGQKKIHDSEDCLFLNIYSPAGSANNGLPVMVWIHGGGFVVGSGDMYAADTLAGFGDVIVVTLNYRLSIWGFFTTGLESSLLNNGLWDQHLAIRWVHDNIATFGGDTKRVTIFGESAGSASVLYQSLYEGNRGLFHRAIAQSGGVTAPWAGGAYQRSDAERLGKLVGCPTDNPVTLYECIKSTPSDILNATVNDPHNGYSRFPLPFRPVIDGVFIPEDRDDIFVTNSDENKHPFFTSIPLLTGLTSAEGVSLALFVAKGDPENFLPNKTYFEETLIPDLLKLVYGQDISEAIIVATIAQYTDWSDPENPEKIRDMFTQLCSDIFVADSVMKVIHFHGNNSNAGTYLYQLNINPTYHYLPSPSWFKQTNHVDDLIYLFGFGDDGILSEMSDIRLTLKDWELQVAKDMMTFWTNFAKTGDPNKPVSVQQEWQRYNPATQKYFEITEDISPASVKQYLYASYANFWDKVVPSIFKAIGSSIGGSSLVSEQDGTCQKERCSP